MKHTDTYMHLLTIWKWAVVQEKKVNYTVLWFPQFVTKKLCCYFISWRIAFVRHIRIIPWSGRAPKTTIIGIQQELWNHCSERKKVHDSFNYKKISSALTIIFASLRKRWSTLNLTLTAQPFSVIMMLRTVSTSSHKTAWISSCKIQSLN